MEPTVIAYIGFIVAALILIWAIWEMKSRLLRRKKIDAGVINTWVELNTSSTNTPNIPQEEPLALSDDNNEYQADKPKENIHMRAQQNGHHSESKKRL